MVNRIELKTEQSDRPKFTKEEIEKFDIPEELQGNQDEQGHFEEIVQEESNTSVEDSNTESHEDTPEEELILGKFKTQDDLEKAYKELENKFHTEPEKSEEANEEVTEEEIKQAVKEDMGDASQEAQNAILEASKEYFEKGTVDESTFDQLEKAGIPKEIAKEFQELTQLKEATQLKEIMDSIGGEDSFEEMNSWAADNLSQSEIDSYNKIVDNGTMNEIQFAVTNLKARRDNQRSTKPSLVKGNITVSDSDTYQSQMQIINDMRDPRYKTDAAYRKKIESKIQRSNL